MARWQRSRSRRFEITLTDLHYPCKLIHFNYNKPTCTFNYKKLNLDDILIHSKLHTEDEDSEEYVRVHSENNCRRSRFLVTDTDLSL